MLMYQHETECLAKRFFAVIEVKDTVRAHINQNMIVSAMTSELLILLQLNLVW